MKKQTRAHDTDLREAVRRIESRKSIDEPSDKLLAAIMQQVETEGASGQPDQKHRKLKHLWPIVGASLGAAAAVLIAFILFKPTEAKKEILEQGSVVEQVKQEGQAETTNPAPQEIERTASTEKQLASNKPSQPKRIASRPPQTRQMDKPVDSGQEVVVPEVSTRQPEETISMPVTQTSNPNPPEEQSLTEIQLPAERQALVDIFLAEEALQVAYERQAQQENLRAYLSRLSGGDTTTAKPIIAF